MPPVPGDSHDHRSGLVPFPATLFDNKHQATEGAILGKVSLRDCYDRFFKASTEVEGLTRREAVAAFQRGLRNEDLVKRLIITPPNSFADVSALARMFMVVEESISAWKKKEHDGEKIKDHPREDDHTGGRQSSWIEKFTPLKA
ncbi:hypothetical protein CRG98_040874 [Punica granatum]|uniref:Retrotransposon gag domain-containing protein n=1 Tax=Punica granatum TaxID=22663 RepID=A0A2I0I479_PUNGR|nr:hypothetical protein CRG98_040874 [Punica granatum]